VLSSSNKPRSGVFLSVFGFRHGQLKGFDVQKARRSKATALRLHPTTRRARKMFVDQMRSTLSPSAKDAKLQVDSIPHWSNSYGCIGLRETDVAPARISTTTQKMPATKSAPGHTVKRSTEIVLAGPRSSPASTP